MIMITVTVHYNISAWRHHLCRGSGHIETHFTNCLYCEIIVTHVELFSGVPHDLFYKLSVCIRRVVHVAPSSMLCHHLDNSCFKLHVALFGLCLPKKFIELYRYIQLLQVKKKGGII